MGNKNWMRILMVFVCLMLVCTCVLAEDCAHPEGRQQVMYSDWEDATFVNNNDGRTHTATYINPFEMIKCMDCGLEYRNDLTMDPVVEPHGFARGECDCGAVEEDTGCAHANSTYSHEGSLGEREFVPLNAEQHQKSYTPLDVYVCNDCGCTYDRVGEYKTVTEAHRFKDGVCRYCQAVAAAAEYTLTYTFENHPFGIDMYTTPVMSGTVVTLDVPVGEVAENQETGDMARMKSWTEDVPMGATAVQFSTSEDDWGNTAYSFTMPARNVIVHGVWETVYSVVYVDNAWNCDDKFEDEWHMVAYGEPTPLYKGGEEPYHEGYWFAGWRPEIAETVTENARYAAWFGLNGEDCAHFDFHCISEYETRLPEGAEWTPDNAGFHTVYGWSGAVYICDTCGKELLDGSYGDLKRMCQDGDDEDALCDTCGWAICGHESLHCTDEDFHMTDEDGWVYLGAQHHGATCTRGEMWECDQCDYEDFRMNTGEQYCVYECYDSDDEDDECDACGSYHPCNHENANREDKFYHYAGEAFKDNGDGTHTGMAREMYGFWCTECSDYIATVTHEEEREYTKEHNFNEDGICDADGCGARRPDCDHSDATFNERGEQFNPTYEDLKTGEHARWFDVFHEYTCNDCNAVFLRFIERGWEPEGHRYEDGWCTLCGVQECAHEDQYKNTISEGVYIPVMGERWYSEGWGYHYGNAILCNVYYCSACHNEVYEYLGEEEWVSKEDCYSNDGDIWCDACGWPACAHENREAKDEYPQWDGDAYYIGSNEHAVMARNGREYYCPDCDTYLFDAYENFREYIYQCWDSDDEDTQCDECGADYCAHEHFTVENDNHHQPVNGESWQHVGWGHHGANCRVGVWGHCQDCGEDVALLTPDYQEYRVEQCWEGDTQNNTCDGCGCEFDGNWGTCNHEGEQEYFNHYSVNDDGWVDNGNGTHTGMAIEVWGFNCRNCGEFFGRPNHDDYRLYTVPHGYNSETGKCWDCGAEMTDCWHDPHIRTGETLVKDTHYMDNDDGTHMRFDRLLDLCICQVEGCGAQFYLDGDEIMTTEGHAFNEDGWCVCGAKNCAHEGMRLEEPDMIRLIWNTGWECTGHNTHTGTGVKYDRYFCDECQHTVLVPVNGTGETEDFEIDCFSRDDGDSWCDDCGWYFACENHDPQVIKPEHYELRDGEDWHFIGDGQHKGQCDKGTWYHCYGCDQGWFADPVEFDVEFIGDCWDENGDESCDGCGAYVAPCPHHYTSDWHIGYDWVSEWVDNENGTHSFNGYELWGFDCYDCGQFIGDRRHDDEREYTFVHSYDENGNCGCGAVYSGCDHENATFNRKGKNYNTVVEDLFDGRHVRWFDVYHEYTCDDCGAIFMRYMDRGEEIEEHVSHNGECCDICGAPVCDHAGKNLVREDVILLEPGRNWNWSTHGSHTGYGVKGDIYYCEACDHDVYERYENQEPQYLTEDCFDGDDEDNRCDVCGWVFCEHNNKELWEENFHNCVEDEGWYYAGDYKHSAVCEVGDWYFCHDCGEYVFDKKVDAQLYTYSCWDDNFDGSCDTCGAESCRHEDIEVKNERHYQPARGHQWQHVGWTHHAAECDVGITFYCNDCGAEGFRRDYREYITERCWEGDNKDNVCDGCGEGFGENWGDCEHNSENNYYYNHYELKDGEQWVINDNGTHSGWAIEVWGFHCELCGNHVATRNHDDYRWYTVPHSFNEENKTCHDCGAAVPDCHHEHGEPTGETAILYAEYVNNDDGTHMVVARLLDEFKCQDCGETFLRDDGSNAEYSEEHTYENGECIHCAYPECDHSDLSKLRLEEEGMIRPIWGTDWRADNRNWHTCMGVKYDRYTCEECGWAWLVPVNGTGEKEYFEEKCYDHNDDNHCDVCGWYFCDHRNVDVINSEHYEPVPGAHWEYAGNGHHTALCDKGYWEYCYDCDREYFVDPYEFNVIGYMQCFDHDGDGHCDACGAWAECRHEGNTGNWYSQHHCETWTDNGDGTHTGWGYEVRGYDCYDCGEFVGHRTHEEEREYIFEHLFDGENGTCGACGAEPGCMHENATFNERGTQKNTTFEDLFDDNHARWFDLYHEYTCDDCGTVFLRYMGRVYEYEPHYYNMDDLCACGAKQCWHENKELLGRDVYMTMPGYEWLGEGQGYHWTEWGSVYNIFYCSDCQSEIREFAEGYEPQENLYQDCYDDDNNGRCDQCGYPTDCAHENKEERGVCHWWKRGEVPVYVGNYQHEVLAHEGMEYYCPDCDELIFQAYEEFKLYTFGCYDENGNGWCDHCNAEMCRHEGNTSPWRNEYHCDWEYYDENLHHGWGYEMHGFECYDCGEFVCDPTHEEEREFFEQHYYNEETGRCWQCDAELTCSHEHGATRNDEAEDVKLNEVYENLFDGTHARWFDRYHEYTCNECGDTFLRYEGRACDVEEHEGNNEVACPCGWAGCKHENTEPGEQGIVRPLPGYSFHGEGMGYHWTEKGAVYNISYCNDCEQPVFEIVGEVQDNIRENCFDGDDDNDECDVCGWPVDCTHPNREERDECHWWIDNAMPEHIGAGLHEVLAHFGMMYYCPDCDRDFFDAYEGYKLYAFGCEDRNGDGLCDDCRVEMECEHNGDGKEWREDIITGPWTDNGDGTHSAEGYKIWGFDCDCGEFIGHPMVDDKMIFTYEHYFEDGKCHCGAEKTCDHEDITPIDGGDFFNRIYENLYDGTHRYTFDVFEWTHCNTCGEDFLRHLVTEEKTEEHDFSEGDCPCGAADCDHAEKTLRAADEFHLMSDWQRDYRGHHEAWGAFYDRYNCDLCRETVLVQKSDEGIHTFDCFDNDEDGECDECGYDFCQHPNLEPMNDNHYEPIPGREWEYNGNGTHWAECRVAVLMWCPDCGHHTRDYISNEIVTITQHCWDEEDGGDGYCDDCGGEYIACEHESKELINPWHYEPVEGDWQFAGDGRHTAICDYGPIYWCPDCERHVFEPVEFGVEGNWPCSDEEENDGEGDGFCDGCGAEYVPCEHPEDKLKLDNPEHWELVEGQEWVYAGNGHHKALCNIGPGYICERCDEYILGAFERLNVMIYDLCWDENGDKKCEDCGAEDVCDHENADGYDWVKEYVCDEWTDNGDGTHSGMGYEKEGFYCPDCDEFIAGNTHENLVEFTMPHEYGEDGLCVKCGAEQPTCEHENVTPTGAEPERVNPWIGDRYDGQHIIWYNELITYTCDACGETVKRLGEERKWELQNHTFEGGECVCGAKDCAHANTTLLQENDFIHSAGDWWQPDGHGKHDVSGAWYDVYTCEDCGAYVYDLVRAEENVVEDCIDEDADNHCDVCAWEFCEHPEDRVIQTGWSVEQESFADTGDGRTHEATYTNLLESYRCLACGTTWEYTAETETRTESHAFMDGVCSCGALDDSCEHEGREWNHEVKRGEVCFWLNENEHVHSYIPLDVFFCPDCGCSFDVAGERVNVTEAHEFDENGECRWCETECSHPEDAQTLRYWQGGEVDSYTDHGDSYHTVVYVTATENYECGVCGEKYQVLAEMKEDIQTHSYVDGKCACGAQDDRCEHKNREWRYENRKDGQYVCLNAEYHSADYTVLDMYQCMDCNCYFSVEGEHKTVAEEAHVLIGENECGYCGTITAGCAHVNKEFIDETVESLTYTDNGNGETHTITLTNVTEIWHCNTCGEEFEIHVDVKSEIKSHVFWDGVCKCGMLVNAHCEHANHSDPVEDSRVDAAYTCVSNTHHEVTYVPLMRYDCTDCGCRVMTHEEKTTVTEAHEKAGETGCVYCGVGELYTLTFQFVGEGADEGYSWNVKAGDLTKLPIPVGETFENGGNPIRLKSWTVPEGDAALRFTTAEDEWGNLVYSFNMPDRDVTVIGEWEKVYAVVYDDGIEGVDLFQEWHTCSYGEATPAFKAVDKLVRKGYVFKGWDPEVAETVTDHVYYYAQWAECAHENYEYTGNAAASSITIWSEWIEGNDYKHTELYEKYQEAQCLDCGTLFSVMYEEGSAEADHVYVNDQCQGCAYKCSHGDQTDDVCDACGTDMSCKHALDTLTLIEQYHYKLAKDSQWTSDGKGNHVAVATLGSLYYCGECEKYVFVALDEEKEHSIQCVEDEDANGLCDVCGGALRDMKAPSFAFVELSPKTGVVGCEAKIVAQFTDETELGRYELYINDVLADEGELSGTEGEFEFTTTELEIGEHYFKVMVYDAAGNRSRYDFPPVTITPANGAPVIGELTSSAGDEFLLGTEVTFAATVTDDRGLIKVELLVDGVVMKSMEPGDVQCVIDLTVNDLTVGEHVIRVMATDDEGLAAEKSLTVNVICEHSWNNGECGNCGQVCEHSWNNGVCSNCNMVCLHNWNDGVCMTCTKVCEHNWNNGVCDICSKICQHSWNNGKCDTCGKVCEHIWNNGACGDCGMACEHIWNGDDLCDNCGMTCAHENKFLESDVFYQFAEGEDFVSDDEGHHSANATLGKRYTCNDCGKFIFVPDEGEEERLHVLDCDSMNDGKCSICGYCWHYGKYPTGGHEEELLKREVIDDYQHKDDVRITDEMYCPKCDKVIDMVIVKTFIDDHTYESGMCTVCEHLCSHADVTDGVCDACGSNVKNDAPVVTSFTCSAGEEFKLGTKVTFSATVTDDRRLSKVELFVDGKSVNTTSVNEPLYFFDHPIDNLTVGEHVISVVVTDAEGLTDEKSLTVNVICEHAFGDDNICDNCGYVKPMIISQPADATVAVGETAKYTVKAEGEGLTYQWYYRTSSTGKWTPSTSGKTETYTFTMRESYDGREIYCQVTDGNGTVVNSETAKLTLKPMKKAEITAQPVSAKVAVGKTAKFTVAAEGDGIEYQWYYRSSGASKWTASTSGTTATYSFTMRESYDGREIYCEVSDKYGNVVNSDVVRLNLPSQIEITSQPADATVAVGETAKFTIAAEGEELTYQWYYRSSGASKWTASTSGTTATYTFTMKESYDGREIYCLVTDGDNNTMSSETAKLTLLAPKTELKITSQPTDATVAVGETAKFTIAAEGENLTYQWYYRSSGASKWTASTSGTTATYTFDMKASFDGREIYCVVTDGDNNTVSSNTVKLTLLVPKTELKITSQPTDATVALGETAKFTIAAEGEELNYQWYYIKPGASAPTKASSTSASYSFAMKESFDGRQIYCVVTDADGNEVTSSKAKLTLERPAVAITSQPADATVATGETAKFTVSATGDGLTYQWYFIKPGASAPTKASSTSASYSFTMKESYDGRQIYCVVTDTYGNTVTSSKADLTLKRPAAAITSQPADAAVAVGETAKFSVSATGDGLTYQWYFIKPGASAPTKASSTSASYSFTMKESYDGRQIYCVVTDTYGNTVTSSKAKLTLVVPKVELKITSNPKDATVAVGETAKFSVSATGEGLKYQWYYIKAGSSTPNTASSTSASYSFTMKESFDGRQIYCVVTDGDNNTVTSSKAKLTLE